METRGATAKNNVVTSVVIPHPLGDAAVSAASSSPAAPETPARFSKKLTGNPAEPLGPKIRRQRRRLGHTLEELARLTGISKPYLSLIETQRMPNPPSDEKLHRLERALGFTPGELIGQAHLERTPSDVRAMLGRLIGEKGGEGFGVQGSGKDKGEKQASLSPPEPRTLNPQPVPINLDDAYLTGVLQEIVERTGNAANVEPLSAQASQQATTGAVPVINRVSAGYPRDFTDLSYPKGVADDYVGCPDVRDKDAFAARVHGDSMTPKYRQGDVVIFSPAATPKNGDDCFVRFEDGQTTFKRAFFETDDDGQPVIRLQPRNEKYPPRTLPAEQISGLYKAVYKYQRVDEGD